jgi:hypothetical protein
MSTTLAGFDQNFNLGEDGSNIILQDVNGNNYNLGQVKGFHSTPKDTDVTLQVINAGGRELTRVERYGGTIEFSIARKDGTLERIQYALQQNKRNGLGELYFRCYQYVNNPNGTVNEYLFTGCTFKLTDMGDYSLGKEVDQKVQLTWVDFQVIA